MTKDFQFTKTLKPKQCSQSKPLINIIYLSPKLSHNMAAIIMVYSKTQAKVCFLYEYMLLDSSQSFM